MPNEFMKHLVCVDDPELRGDPFTHIYGFDDTHVIYHACDRQEGRTVLEAYRPIESTGRTPESLTVLPPEEQRKIVKLAFANYMPMMHLGKFD